MSKSPCNTSLTNSQPFYTIGCLSLVQPFLKYKNGLTPQCKKSAWLGRPGPAQAGLGRPRQDMAGLGWPGLGRARPVKNLKITLAWPGPGRPRPVNNSKWRFPLALAGLGQPFPAWTGLVQPGPINASFQEISTGPVWTGPAWPFYAMLNLEILTGLIKPCPSKASLLLQYFLSSLGCYLTGENVYLKYGQP